MLLYCELLLKKMFFFLFHNNYECHGLHMCFYLKYNIRICIINTSCVKDKWIKDIKYSGCTCQLVQHVCYTCIARLLAWQYQLKCLLSQFAKGQGDIFKCLTNNPDILFIMTLDLLQKSSTCSQWGHLNYQRFGIFAKRSIKIQQFPC